MNKGVKMLLAATVLTLVCVSNSYGFGLFHSKGKPKTTTNPPSTGGGSTGGGSNGGGSSNSAPIDGGIGVLLVAGAAYGAKKIADRKKAAKA